MSLKFSIFFFFISQTRIQCYFEGHSAGHLITWLPRFWEKLGTVLK